MPRESRTQPRRELMEKFKSTRSQEIDPTAGDGVAGDGVAGDGVASDGVASDGAASDGVASDGVASDGVASDGVASDGVGRSQLPGAKPLDMSNSAMAEQIAQVA